MSSDPRHSGSKEGAAKPPAKPGESGFLPRQHDELPPEHANDDMDGISRHDFEEEPPRKAASGSGCIDYRHLRNAQSNRFDDAYRGRSLG